MSNIYVPSFPMPAQSKMTCMEIDAGRIWASATRSTMLAVLAAKKEERATYINVMSMIATGNCGIRRWFIDVGQLR